MSMKPSFDFKPGQRGVISEALKTRSDLKIVAPESPRPVEMLTGIRVEGELLGVDLALHDLLVSKAYEGDKDMLQASYRIPFSEALTFLGRDYRKTDVIASLRKMKDVLLTYTAGSRTYSRVPMLVAWEEIKDAESSIGYQFPEPVRILMRDMLGGYGYIELAAVGQGAMKSKHSHAIYKHLVHELRGQHWSVDGGNERAIAMSPEELADLIGFPLTNGKVAFGKLNERVLSHLIHDLSTVQRFDLYDITFDGLGVPKRGTPVTSIEFQIRLSPPSPHLVKASDANVRERGFRVGGADVDRYRVNSVTFMRIEREFGDRGLVHFLAWKTWQVALQEAIDGKPITKEYARRKFRGASLLSYIDERGADDACWNFFAEEYGVCQDLVMHPEVNKRLSAAEKARIKRLKEPKFKKRRVRGAQVEQTAALENPGELVEVENFEIPDFGGAEVDAQADSAVERFRAMIEDIEDIEDDEPPTKALPKQGILFEEANLIIIDIDDAYNQHDIDDRIWQRVQDFDWTGDRKVRMHVKYRTTAGVYDRFETDIKPYDFEEFEHFMRSMNEFVDGEAIFRRTK